MLLGGRSSATEHERAQLVLVPGGRLVLLTETLARNAYARRVTTAGPLRRSGMSTAAHLLPAKDALTALAPLVTYPGRCWLALCASPFAERRPAAITYFESSAAHGRQAA